MIDYQNDNAVLVMTKGHPFNREDFLSVFDGIEGINACSVEQPASQAFFNPELAKDYRAFVLYDMPGMDFFKADADDGLAPRYIEPPTSFKENFLALLEQGHGFVFLHHTIAAWPAWPEYAEIIGGKFLYKPGQIRGVDYPDSGYRHEITHQVSVLQDHPVTAGVSQTFSINDELYLSHVFDDSVIPLLSSDYDYCDSNFYSSQQAVTGTMFSREGWHHAPGHNLIGWVKHYKNSPIVYLQCGDSKAAYDSTEYQTLLSNAINWVASDEAKQWARDRNNHE
ncbi:ThuA domain-containing protein [Oceanicoccus sagamiensis]|nr:ThuA domain-containing protein [Oceanicoccus sagamiensis]